MQANLVNARKNLSYSVVTAPASGIVGTIDYREGSLVSPTTLLTVLSNSSDMRASFSLNEKDILNMTDNGSRSIQKRFLRCRQSLFSLLTENVTSIPGK